MAISAVRAFRRLATPDVRRLLGVALLLGLFINLLFLVLPLVLILVYDKVVPARSEETLIGLSIAAAAALVLQGFLLVIRNRLVGRLALILERDVGEVALRAAMDRARAGSSGAAPAHEHLSRLRQLVATNTLTACLDLPWVLVFLVPIWLLHAWLGMIAVVGLLLLLLIAVAADRLSADAARSANEAAAEARRAADRAIDAIATIDALAMRPGVLARWREASFRAVIDGYRAHDRAGAMAALSKGVRQAVQLAILLAAVQLVLLDEVTVGIIFAASILASRALAPIEVLAGGWRQIGMAVESLRQLDAMLQTPPARPRAVAATGMVGALEVEGLSLHPREATRAVLRSVSFALASGEALAVSGPSGAGKSALSALLVGAARATVGEVRIDGTALRHWEPDALGRAIGYLPEDPDLLPGSVAANIARFAEATPDEVVAAARLAGVHEMILGLPEGYATMVGARARLSPAQRRRIALARALFGNPRLLVLDEPNLGLDRDAERHLIETLKDLKASGVTIVLVAHRITDRSLFDRVLVLQAGAVSQFGPLEGRPRAGEAAPASLPRAPRAGLRPVEGR